MANPYASLTKLSERAIGSTRSAVAAGLVRPAAGPFEIGLTVASSGNIPFASAGKEFATGFHSDDGILGHVSAAGKTLRDVAEYIGPMAGRMAPEALSVAGRVGAHVAGPVGLAVTAVDAGAMANDWAKHHEPAQTPSQHAEADSYAAYGGVSPDAAADAINRTRDGIGHVVDRVSHALGLRADSKAGVASASGRSASPPFRGSLKAQAVPTPALPTAPSVSPATGPEIRQDPSGAATLILNTEPDACLTQAVGTANFAQAQRKMRNCLSPAKP